MLRNFRASGAAHLITTTFTGPRPNRDTSGGNWRTLNLTLAPFDFPPPLLTLNENCSESGGEYGDKSLGSVADGGFAVAPFWHDLGHWMPWRSMIGLPCDHLNELTLRHRPIG